MAKMVNPELEVVRFENEDVVALSFRINSNGTVSAGTSTYSSKDGISGTTLADYSQMMNYVFGTGTVNTESDDYWVADNNGNKAKISDVYNGTTSTNGYAGSYNYTPNTSGSSGYYNPGYIFTKRQ